MNISSVWFSTRIDLSRKSNSRQFMFAQSQPISEMIDFIIQLRKNYSLKVAAVSNEGRELTIHRIKQFKLNAIIDMFISSCFVHFRKPDRDIYRLALDCVQVPPEKVIYIDDRAMFVEVAKSMGIRGIHHTDYESTRTALETLGLSSGQGEDHERQRV